MNNDELNQNNSSEQEKLSSINKTLDEPMLSFDRLQKSILKIDENMMLKSTFAKNVRKTRDFNKLTSSMMKQLMRVAKKENLETKQISKISISLSKLLTQDQIQLITDTYPVRDSFAKLPKSVRHSFAVILNLIKDMNEGDKVELLNWIVNNLVSSEWHGKPSGKNPKLLLCGVFKRHNKFCRSSSLYWGIMDQEKNFSLYDADSLEKINSFHVNRIEKSKNSDYLLIWNDSKKVGEKLTVLTKYSVDTWLRTEPLTPLSFPYYHNNVPDFILDVFQEALIAPDTYLLRALLDFDVLKINIASNAMEDLYIIFSFHGLVNRYISAVCANEFDNPSLTEGTVLRRNSHLTFLFSVFYKLFTSEFTTNVLKPIIKHVNEVGNLGIKERDASKIDEISELLNWIIDKFIKSKKYISYQLRHFASVLSTNVAIRLKTKHSVFNALSSFMFLRYTNAIIANTSYYEKGERSNEEIHKISLEIAQLLQLPFNLQLISERYDYLSVVSERLLDRYEEIYNFILSLGNFNKTVEYPKPTKQQCMQSLANIMKYASTGKEVFAKRYSELYNNDNKSTASSLALASLISHLFK